MANYLEYTVLPGNEIEHHEHRRLLVVLAVLVIVAIVFVLALLYKAGQQEAQPITATSTVTLADQIAAELRRSVVEVSQQQKTAIARELSKAVVKVTDKQKADIANELANSVVK